ncbi:MAG: FG-GAP repeat protein [Verrucomicrobia bacterium]|nr:FG-GAP repeat protein [Verrucomicrobiota bacterium]
MASRFHETLVVLLPLAAASATFAALEYDGDGQTEIVWQRTDTPQFAAWFLEQHNFVTSGWIPNDVRANSRIAAVADFNRDGHADLLWRSPSTGENEIWLMNRTNRVARLLLASSSTEFEAIGAADFNGDGYPDILWRDPARSITAVWYMEGTKWTGRAEVLPQESEFDWTLAATGDFNHDGYADIVWHDRYSGRNFLWLMKGTELLESVELQPQPDFRAQLVGSGIFNVLGNADLLWRHANGQNSVWLMSGTQYLSSAALPAEFDSNWRIAGAGGFTNGMRLSAIADVQSRSLTLLWRHGSVLPPAIERRPLGQTAWEVVATNYLPARLTNTDLLIGQRYEYRVAGETLLTAIAEAPIEERGKVILVIEESLAGQIADELQLLKADLIGDGWSVVSTNVPRHDDDIWADNLEPIASIKSFITNAYFQDPAMTKAVYLIGHVPIPYSGFHNPDGHGSRASPADLYYGDVDGIYTDSKVNFTSFLEGPTLSRHGNLIGDGKFDQNKIPENAQGVAELELAVGRADFANLPAFGPRTEIELTQRYIRKTHRYRHKEIVLPDRVVVGTYFPFGPNRTAYDEALKVGSRLFGVRPDQVVEGDAFDPKNSAVWGILGGFGLPFAVIGRDWWYHQTADMVHLDLEPRLAFASLFASYTFDFAYVDNFMRAFLAAPTYGLAIMWFRPVLGDGIPLAFESLGLGEPIGSGFVRSINESQRQTVANTYIALLGDPTLRAQVTAPPRIVPRNPDSFSTVQWEVPLETNTTFVVYRSMNHLDGPWLRLTPTPVTGTNFSELFPPYGPKLYQVRAARLVATGSGSYTNLSQGVFVEEPQNQ